MSDFRCTLKCDTLVWVMVYVVLRFCSGLFYCSVEAGEYGISDHICRSFLAMITCGKGYSCNFQVFNMVIVLYHFFCIEC